MPQVHKCTIFADTLEIVARESEIPASDILSHKRTDEVVDARYIFVYLLSRRGFYASGIASRMGFTRSSISYILANFDNRRYQSGTIFESVLRNSLSAVVKQPANNPQTTNK